MVVIEGIKFIADLVVLEHGASASANTPSARMLQKIGATASFCVLIKSVKRKNIVFPVRPREPENHHA